MKHPDDDPVTEFPESMFRETAVGLPRAMRRIPPPAPRTPWGWAVTGVVLGTVLCVLLFAPARWLSQAVASASHSRVQLANPLGSLWNGSAQLLLTAGPDSADHAALPGRISWRIRPRWTGLALEFSAPCCLAQPWRWTVELQPNGLQLRLDDHASAWPAAMLQGLGTPWNTLQMDAGLELSTHSLCVQWAAGRWSVQGQARLTANDMSTRLSPLKPVGSSLLELQGGDSATLTLSTVHGPLLLSGQGQWIGGTLRFTGEATAQAEHAAELTNLLNILGRREGARSIIKVG